jgi:CRISPR-associated protein Csh1
MINNFGMVGKSILTRDGYFECQNKIKKRELFLLHHTLMPVEKKDSIDRAIVLNFDLEKNEFRFELDKEIDDTNRDYFFAFKVGASNDKKKFLSTNNIESFLNRLMTDSLFYINDKRSQNRTSQWFKENIALDYDQLLEQIKSNFYKKEGEAYILDDSKMAAEYTEQYQKVKKDLEENRKDKNKPISPEKVYIRFLIETFKEGKKVNLPSIFLVKIDGNHIMELEKYRDSYINLVYYDLFERFFVEDILKEKRCHVCREKKDVIGKIPLPMKFYGTTNSLYFENVKNTNAYKSFALCKECLKDVLVGMKYTENYLKNYMFGLNCYLVPTLTGKDSSFEKKLKGAVNILKKRGTKYKDDIEVIKKILEKSGRGDINRKFTFNLLFYFAEQQSQSFDILKYISDIELRQLIIKMELFDKYTEMYNLELLGEFGSSLCLNDIRYYLFPSDQSHNKPDVKLYGKDLLNFLENFLNENHINYFELVGKFTDIFKRRFNRERIDRLSPFKMVLFLTILFEIKILKEGSPMNKGSSITKIMKREYDDFFKNHRDVYEDNCFRQGLFLLGTVISKIVYAQRSKKKTFLSKINFDGIPARRIKNLVGEVKEYADIYQVYEEKGIWGNIMDRLQGIETSGMKGDEIVFYILTGVSYEDYLGMKHGLEKKLNQDKGENDE